MSKTSLLVDILPSDLISSTIYLRQGPISFDKRPYLMPIYNANYSDILLKTGRQCEKSTTMCCKMLGYSFVYHMFNSLYITNTKPQAKDFSDLKLEPIMNLSPEIQEKFIGPKLRYAQNVFFKKFLTGSTIKLKYAETRKLIYQGLSSDLNAIDELQDILSDSIPLINETLSHSEYRYKIYAGTPKGTDNTLEYFWNISSQNEWLVSCEHCKLANYIDEANIGLKGLICRKCGKRIYPENGFWASNNPKSHIKGFRIPQLIVPWKQGEIAWRDLLITIKQYSEEKFYNLILALPFGYGLKPITEFEIQSVCLGEFMEKPSPQISFYKKFGSIDWGTGLEGKSDTTLNIMIAVSPYDYRYIYIKRYRGGEWASNPTKVLEDIIRIFKRFKVDFIAADYGFGFMQNDTLRNIFGFDRVWPIYESSSQKAKMKWKKDSEIFTINKTLCLDGFFEAIRKKQLIFPLWNKFQTYAEEILNEHIEIDSRTRRKYYDHSLNTNDDYLHSAMFAKVAADYYFGKT